MSSTILCPIDFKHESLAAEAAAMRFATALGCDVTFMNVEEGYERVSETIGPSLIATMPKLREKLLEAASKQLESRIKHVKATLETTGPHRSLIASGRAAEQILSTKTDKSANVELVVLAKKRTNFLHDFFLGSVSQSVLDNASLPILCIPDHPQYEKWSPREIILASDLKNDNEQSLNWACQLAKRFAAKVKIVHVLEPFYTFVAPEVAQSFEYQTEIEILREKQCNNKLKEEEARCDLTKDNVTSELLIGSPTEMLSRYMTSEKNSILVLETHRHKNKVGHLAHAIARSAAFPVLFVPQVSSTKK